MRYTRVIVKCYTYEDMIQEYVEKYKKDYQLIGYQFNAIDHHGELVLYPRYANKC